CALVVAHPGEGAPTGLRTLATCGLMLRKLIRQPIEKNSAPPIDFRVNFTLGHFRPVHRGASSRGVVKVGRDAAPASVANASHVPGRHSGSLPAALETAGRSDWP